MTKNDLEKLADEIMSLGTALLEQAPIEKTETVQDSSYAYRLRSRYLFDQEPPPEIYTSYSWGTLNDELSSIQSEATQKYQQFYSSALTSIKEHLPDREVEFVENYQGKNYRGGVFGYLSLTVLPCQGDRRSTIQSFKQKFSHQKNILLSIEINGDMELNATDGYERKEQRMEDRNVFINSQINQAVFTGKGDIDMGDTIGDQINVSGGTVERIETGDKFYDQAQQLIQTLNAQSPQEDIVKVLAAIQEELTKLELPEAVKEEALNEVKGAEIQIKKEKPDKPKLVERLKNAQNVLTGMENLGMKAVAIGNLLVKAIEWAEQLLT